MPKRYIDNKESSRNLLDMIHYILYELTQYNSNQLSSSFVNSSIQNNNSIDYSSSIGAEID